MPFVSAAQRRLFYAKADRGEISRETVKEWEDATPKDKKLPMHVKKAYAHGLESALIRFGLKTATTEEIRLQLPRREYHGLDAALRSTARGEKKAEGPNAEQLAEVLRTFDEPEPSQAELPSKSHLNRSTLWSSPSHLGAGDTANRVSNMGQPTQIGTAF